MKLQNKHRSSEGFSLVDLLAGCAGLFLFALLVLPALGRTHNNNSLAQSINNLRQLMNAWSMYPAQNNGRIVYSYPKYGSNTNTWCQGDAESGGGAGSYSYGGADPNGIKSGDLWPYVQNLAPYKCPTDNRFATGAAAPYKNQPILRSYVINSYMAGAAFPDSATIATPSSWDSTTYRLFVRESQISKPAELFVFIEEDGASINDGMLFMDMGTARLLDLPARHHANSYPLTFADGHAGTVRLQEATSMNWVVGQAGGRKDWQVLTNMTSVPR